MLIYTHHGCYPPVWQFHRLAPCNLAHAIAGVAVPDAKSSCEKNCARSKHFEVLNMTAVSLRMQKSTARNLSFAAFRAAHGEVAMERITSTRRLEERKWVNVLANLRGPK